MILSFSTSMWELRLCGSGTGIVRREMRTSGLECL